MANPNIFYNDTGIVGNLIVHGTDKLTGDLFLTLLMVLFVVLLIAFIFRLPLELMLIFVTPLILVYMAFAGGSWVAIGGVLLIILAIITAKNWFIK